MKNMKLNVKKIDESKLSSVVHAMNVKNGFYERYDEDGFIENQLMKADGELSELFEARRKDNYTSNRFTLEDVVDDITVDGFKKDVKDTFEDELADLAIYAYDWLGSPMENPDSVDQEFTDWLNSTALKKLDLSQDFNLYMLLYGFKYHNFIENPHNTLKLCNIIATAYGINLRLHIFAKLAYNDTRGNKHGKLS